MTGPAHVDAATAGLGRLRRDPAIRSEAARKIAAQRGAAGTGARIG